MARRSIGQWFWKARSAPFFSNRCMNGRMHQGQEKCAEAKVSILGGHTVEDLEPKYGLAVIGGQSKSAEHALCFASLT